MGEREGSGALHRDRLVRHGLRCGEERKREDARDERSVDERD